MTYNCNDYIKFSEVVTIEVMSVIHGIDRSGAGPVVLTAIDL